MVASMNASGLLAALAAALPAVTALCTVSNQEQQQQQLVAAQQPRRNQRRQQQQKSTPQMLAHILVVFLHACAYTCKPHSSDSAQWRALLLPAAQLAEALMGSWPPTTSSSSSNSSSNAAQAAAYTKDVETVVVCMANLVARAEVLDGREAGRAFRQLVQADPAGAASLMTLLHLQVAWALQAEHSRLKGRSPIAAHAPSSSSSSSRRQQGLAVTSYHEDYLAMMGAPTKQLILQHDPPPPPMTMAGIVQSLHLRALMACIGSGSSRSSSGSGNAAGSNVTWKSLETAAVVPSQLQLLLMLEAALLDPEQCCSATAKLFELTVGALRSYDCLEAAVPVLLPLVMDQLQLAVQYVQQPEQLGVDAAETCGTFAAVVTMLLATGNSEPLITVFEQQPLATCRGLELAVRSNPAKLHVSVPLANMSCAVCLDACKLDSQQVVQDLQLFSLPYSCAKRIHAAVSAEDDGASRLAFAAKADSAMLIMRFAGQLHDFTRAKTAGIRPGAAGAADAGVARSSSSSGASSTASAGVSTERLALVLMARGAVAAGEALAALAARGSVAARSAAQGAAHAGEVSPDEDEDIMCFLELALPQCLVCVSALQDGLTAFDLPGDAAVRDSMQQKLLQDLQKLHDEVMVTQTMLHCSGGAEGASTISSSSSGRVIAAACTMLLPGLSERLVACGEALAALCPVPSCCNNPSCTELRGASEPQLVAGKGSVCSRCKTARYCSKACQVAHHPAHKKICKSISASQAK